MHSRSRWLVFLLVLVAMLALAAPAFGVLSGENGRIVFISGREAGDAQARGYLLPVPSNSVGGGTLSPAFTPPASGQFRHPTWSPDRTKVAYANGGEIFVQDIAAGTGPVQVTPTETPNLSGDRPAWSPDGTRIAYEYQSTGQPATDRQIRVQPANDLQLPIVITQLTAAGGTFEGKPAWSPNSSTVYFHRGDPNTATNTNIYRKPSGGGAETLAVSDSGISEAQPSISPDGTKICYTLTNNGFNATADVVVGNLTTPPSGGLIVSKSNTQGDYNCTWSPDAQMIAYANGTFSTGRLVMVRADNTSPNAIELAQDPGGDNFDGNPDWAPDGRPICPDRTINAIHNRPITFAVECTDTGPGYEQSEVREYPETKPAVGTLAQANGDQAGEPFTYTPPPGFTGTVSFRVNSFDALGFGTDRGTVTINVTNVINGTAGNDTINGTPGDDVINCGDGNDVVDGGGGNDVINCGAGNDRVSGGTGNDRILGSTGNDRLNGNSGRDRVNGNSGRDRINGDSDKDRVNGDSGNDRASGGSGNDRVSGASGKDKVSGGRGNDRVSGGSNNDRVAGDSGNDRVGGDSGNDVVSGGSGRDSVSGGSGKDRLSGGSGRDRCGGGSGRDRASRCERSSRIP